MGEVTVTKAQNGQIVIARVGDSIRVELPENPTTGYRWAFTALDDALLELENADSTYRSRHAGLGSGGIATWRLRARAPGRASLALKRWRHWEGEQSVVERFALTLEIKPATSGTA